MRRIHKTMASVFFLMLLLASCRKESSFNLRWDREGLKLKESLSEPQNGAVRQEVWEGEGRRVLISLFKNQELEAVKSRAESQKMLLISLFDYGNVPYPDIDTNRKHCLQDSWPQSEVLQRPEQWSYRIELWANERMAFGGCELLEQNHRAQILYLYCFKSRDLIELRSFWRDSVKSSTILERNRNFVASISCPQ